MSSTPPPPRSRIRRIEVVVALLILAGTLVTASWSTAQPLTNIDTYFHLRLGHEFLHGWSLRDPGSVSSFATADWVPTQWLPEVVMAQAEDWGGLPAVAWLSGLQQILLIVVLYAVGRRQADPLVVAPVVVVALTACAAGLSMRPQVLSYTLMAVTAAAWLATHRDGRVRWWLVPLTWLWAMLHGMWPVGIALGLAAVAGMALDRDVPRRLLARHLAVPVLSAVAAALTPVGPALYPAVLLVSSRARFFGEWHPTDFTSVSGVALVLLFLAVLTTGLRRGQQSWRDLSLIAFAGACALYNGRTLPLAAVLMVPLAARSLQSLRREPAAPFRRERAAVGVSAALCLAALAVVVPRTAADPPPEPAWLAPSIAALPAGTPVANDWDNGGFLLWRFPALDPLMHGYGDMFTTAELQRNTDLLELRPSWDHTLVATGIRVALLPSGSRLAYALVDQEHWRVVHASPDLELLEAPDSWPRP